MRIGIVGSRRRTDREAVEACVSELAAKTIVMTGGTRGPDQWAAEAARSRGLAVEVYEPDLEGVRARWEAADRHYARNQRIIDHTDRIIAFVAPDRKGGTEDTIRRAERAGRPVGLR